MKDSEKIKPSDKSLDDIVFEHRNKEYGCYYLRVSYNKRFILSYSLVVGLLLGVSIFLYFREIFPVNNYLDNLVNTKFEQVQYEEDLLPVINTLPANPAGRPTIQDKPAESENLANQVKRAEFQVKAIAKEITPVKLAKDTTLNKLAEDLLKRHKTNLVNSKAYQIDTLTMVLEKAPLFPGGYTAIQSFFLKNQHYPESALIKGIHGSTIVSFLVSTQGVVERAKVVEGTDPELDREAIRLVNMLPKWQPALYKGKPVACMLVMPVDFTIK